jgi:hypothetical protein
MNSPKRTARIAGLLYLLGGLPAPFSLLYLPSALIVPGNAAATAAKVRASELLLRLGILTDLFSAIVFIFVALTLYRLLKDVDHHQAVLMVILWVVSVPVTFINALNRLAALILVSGADFLSLVPRPQLEAMAMLFLRLYNQGNIVNQIFWGLWLLPFGILVYKSGFIPRILGIFLMIACLGYVTASITTLLSPHYGRIVSGWTMLGPALGEISIVVWLLVKGVRTPPAGEPA